MRKLTLPLLAILILVALALLPAGASAATCSSYSTQAEAQRGADTRDTDCDGIYCESLPCPCARPASPDGGVPPPDVAKPKSSCSRPTAVQRLRFSASKYPNIRAHVNAAIAKGWPRIMVLNRPRADSRRDRLLEDIPTKAGFDRDEYPAAVGRGRANGDKRGLVRGINPIGWMADVRYVQSSENRSHGASLGAKLRGLCNGGMPASLSGRRSWRRPRQPTEAHSVSFGGRPNGHALEPGERLNHVDVRRGEVHVNWQVNGKTGKVGQPKNDSRRRRARDVPRRSDDGDAAGRVARVALAGRRLDGAAHPRAPQLRAREVRTPSARGWRRPACRCALQEWLVTATSRRR